MEANELTDARIIEIRKECFGGRFGTPSLEPWSDSIKFARAIASEALRAQKEGWQWVPVEPTEEMIDAAKGGAVFDSRMDAMFKRGLLANWASMLTAAPQPAAPIASTAEERQDAARYRWLRDGGGDAQWDCFDSHWLIEHDLYGQGGPELDAFIDAALQHEEGASHGK